MAKVTKIEIKWEQDGDADTSWLGVCKSKTSAEYFIDRRDGYLYGPARDDDGDRIALALVSKRQSNREYEFYESCNHLNPGDPNNWGSASGYLSPDRKPTAEETKLFDKFEIIPTISATAPLAYWLDLAYTCQDYERLMAIYNGDISFLYCKAVATYTYDSELGERTDTEETGCGGFESDCGNKELASIEQEQIEELKAMLDSQGIECPKDVEIYTTYS